MKKLSAHELQSLPALSQLFLHNGELYGRFGTTNLLIINSMMPNPSFSDMMEACGNANAWTMDALENGGDTMIGWIDFEGNEYIERYTQNELGDFIMWE